VSFGISSSDVGTKHDSGHKAKFSGDRGMSGDDGREMEIRCVFRTWAHTYTITAYGDTIYIGVLRNVLLSPPMACMRMPRPKEHTLFTNG
jgi:hypothetical protein